MHPKDILITALVWKLLENFAGARSIISKLHTVRSPRRANTPESVNIYEKRIYGSRTNLQLRLNFAPSWRVGWAKRAARKKVTFALPPEGPDVRERLFIVGQEDNVCVCVCANFPLHYNIFERHERKMK